MTGPFEPWCRPRRGLLLLTILGAFLTVRGYRCLDGDQAYRLPAMLHAGNPALYGDDPFVRSFDAFNPHRGSFLVIGLAARPLGLAAGLGLLFVMTFLTAAYGLDRLARAVWPDCGPGVGLLAFGAVLTALAGNIGTNHLFEPILLDRQMAFALGWVALGLAVGSPGRGALWAAMPLGLAAVVHPTVGLQLTMLVGASCVAWLVVPRAGRAGGWMTLGALVGLSLTLLPGLALNMAHSGELLGGLPPDEFRRLSLELQGPQHLLPHLWRLPQWLAWGCYPALAAVAVLSTHHERHVPEARARLIVLIVLNCLGLALAWYGVERLGHLRLTLFQPFRMATVARGLCLILVAGHLVRLWNRGGAVDRTRVALLFAGLAGDWMLVAVTAFEVVMALADQVVRTGTPEEGGAVRSGQHTAVGFFAAHPNPHTLPDARWGRLLWSPFPLRGRHRMVGSTQHEGVPVEVGNPLDWRAETVLRALAWCLLAAGLFHLSRHDTESGHRPLLAVAAAGLLGFGWLGRHPIAWTTGRQVRVALLAWVVPVAALGSVILPESRSGWREALVRRCRLGEVPIDDMERLAVWCRVNTPEDARFVGPPGPKTFRLWSRRSLAFNRAASPYNARGLADWAERFRDHVGFTGPLGTFVQAYLRDRHALESGYDRLTGDQLAALAERQNARYVIAQANRRSLGPLVRLHAEGAWAVFARNEVTQLPEARDEMRSR